MAGRITKAVAEPEADPGEERDEAGLTRWHYLRRRQIICGTCNCRPCAEVCPEQWMADRPQWKAARANRPLEGAPWQGQEQGQGRRIPVEAAMAQAMAVVAGEARAEDMAPVYEEVP